MRIFPAVLLLNAMALSIPLAWADTPPPGAPQLASDPPSWSWKTQDKPSNAYNRYKEVNSGSWKPQNTGERDDTENPLNEGEDSQSYDDGNQ
ncbi:MAG: hypothetical protein GAK37_03834 [Pseudomonas sp.]|nr:MAG: hypothetical protein GAK37_03834 [Pseudomonas sp.]